MSDFEFMELRGQAGRYTQIALILFLIGGTLMLLGTTALLWAIPLTASGFVFFVLLRPARARFAEEVLRRKVVAARALNR